MEQLKAEGKTVFFSTHILSDAEALCDRVAMIHQGELRAVGAVADLTSGVQGKVEIIWQGTSVPASMKALGAECHVTGDTVRAVLPERAGCRAGCAAPGTPAADRGHPVRTSLEQYFVEKLKRSQTTGGDLA